MDKILWKSGQMHIDDVKESFFNINIHGLNNKRTDKWISPPDRNNMIINEKNIQMQ